jgi:hypothetical protein
VHGSTAVNHGTNPKFCDREMLKTPDATYEGNVTPIFDADIYRSRTCKTMRFKH